MLRAAAVQFSAIPFDLTRNLDTARSLVRQAAEQGAQLAVLPELFNTGYVYTPRLAAFAEDLNGVTLRVLSELSAELGMHVAGSLLLRHGGHLYNTLALVRPNGTVACYAKQSPFLWERCYFQPGRGPLIVETDLGRLGCLLGWDIAQPEAWAAYAGQVDALVIASAPPRLHRAVLNFPAGRKVYLAQLLPGLLRERDALDRLYAADLGERAAALGVPVVHAVMAGRFVTQVPFPRLSFLGAALARPRYWPLVNQAHLASLRASFYGSSAVFGPDGTRLAAVETETGLALADLPPARPRQRVTVPQLGQALAPLPWSVRLFARLLQPLAERYYRRNLVQSLPATERRAR